VEQSRALDIYALLCTVVDVLERLGIPYMVVGGFAAILHGEPRLTLDVDIVVDMRLDQVETFVAAFPTDDYYASAEGIRDALLWGSLFNVIQGSTGLKADLVPLSSDAFTSAAFARRQHLPYDPSGHWADVISAEDLVLAKLRIYKRTGSDRHLRDARGVLLMQWDTLNLAAIRRGAREAGTESILDMLLAEVRQQMGA